MFLLPFRVTTNVHFEEQATLMCHNHKLNLFTNCFCYDGRRRVQHGASARWAGRGAGPVFYSSWRLGAPRLLFLLLTFSWWSHCSCCACAVPCVLLYNSTIVCVQQLVLCAQECMRIAVLWPQAGRLEVGSGGTAPAPSQDLRPAKRERSLRAAR